MVSDNTIRLNLSPAYFPWAMHPDPPLFLGVKAASSFSSDRTLSFSPSFLVSCCLPSLSRSFARSLARLLFGTDGVTAVGGQRQQLSWSQKNREPQERRWRRRRRRRRTRTPRTTSTRTTTRAEGAPEPTPGAPGIEVITVAKVDGLPCADFWLTAPSLDDEDHATLRRGF